MLQHASVWVAWPPGERGLTFSSSYTSWVPAAECCRSWARKPQHDYLWLPHARIAENKHLHKQLYNVSARQMQQRKGCWGSDFLQGPTVSGLLQVVALANLLPPDSNTDELDSYMYQTVSSVQQALLMALRPVILQCACCHCTACICKQACLISLHMHACMHESVPLRVVSARTCLTQCCLTAVWRAAGGPPAGCCLRSMHGPAPVQAQNPWRKHCAGDQQQEQQQQQSLSRCRP